MAVPILSKPPRQSGESFVIPYMNGEIWQIPTSNSVMRLLVTGEVTEGAFAVVSTGGTGAEPIGFHYHREAHDIFLCVKGQMNVWADGQCKTLEAGDLASAPPGTIHQYQILGEHSEFCGLIIPGGWEEFFRFVGEPYLGPLFPTRDRRNPFETLIPKIIAAQEKFDLVIVRDHPSTEPQPWTDRDTELPGKLEPYFLKADKGPRWASGGLLLKPLVTPAESNNKFSVARIEGSNLIKPKIFSGYALVFEHSHHAFIIDAGSFSFTIGEAHGKAYTGDTVFVPAGVRFELVVESKHAAAYIFCNQGGLVEVLSKIGKPYEPPVISEGFDADPDDSQWEALLSDLKCQRIKH